MHIPINIYLILRCVCRDEIFSRVAHNWRYNYDDRNMKRFEPPVNREWEPSVQSLARFVVETYWETITQVTTEILWDEFI